MRLNFYKANDYQIKMEIDYHQLLENLTGNDDNIGTGNTAIFCSHFPKGYCQPLESKKKTHLDQGSYLIKAIKNGHFELAKLMLEKCPKWYLRIRTRRGYNALHTACYKGCTELVQILVKQIRVNQKAMYGETALHTAAFYGYVDIIKILLERGANSSKLKDGKYCGLSPSQLTNSPTIKKLLSSAFN